MPGIRRFPKTLIRMLMLVFLGVVWYAGSVALDKWEVASREKQRLTFSLPLPEELQDAYEGQTLRVTNVQIAGFFNDWNPVDPAYRMHPDGKGNYTLWMPFDPGETQYKFVLYLSDPVINQISGLSLTTVWSYDRKARKKADDGYNGYNSIHVAPDISAFRLIFMAACAGIGALLLLYTLLEPILKRLMRTRLPFRVKLVLAVFIAALLSNLAFIAYQRLEMREAFRDSAVETVNLIGNALEARGVNFNRLEDPAERAKAWDVSTNLLRTGTLRKERTRKSSTHLSTLSYTLYDRNFYTAGFVAPDFMKTEWLRLARLVGIDGLRRYLESFDVFPYVLSLTATTTNEILNPLTQAERAFVLSNYRYNVDRMSMQFAGAPGSPAFLAVSKIFAAKKLLNFQLVEKRVRKGLSPLSQALHASPLAIFIADSFISPVYRGNRVVAYIQGIRLGDMDKAELGRVLTFGLFILALAALLTFFLLFNIGGIVTRNLAELTGWTQDILKGNFETEKSLRTGDEIEVLSENFNRMRLSMGSNVKNLRLINTATSWLQKVTTLEEAFGMFLTFVTANFGFGYNRAALFWLERGVLRGHSAIGLLDREEVAESFGSVEAYLRFRLDPEEYFRDFSRFTSCLNCRFSDAVKALSMPENAESEMVRVLREGSVLFLDSGQLKGAEDQKIARALQLENFVLLPVQKGKERMGVLLLDNPYSGRPITAENVEQLQILINDFSATLDNVYLVENLRELDRMKDEFLANTSHELRTPLVGIIGIAESLIDGAAGSLSGEQKKNLSMVAASGKRLSSLVNDLLDFSKLKHRNIEIAPRAVDLRSVAELVLAISRPIIGAKPVIAENLVPEDFPAVHADENRLEQILYNLVGNALKFTEKGRVTVSAAIVGITAEITVADTGIGIPADKHASIFEAFEQAEGSIERRFGGTGLGLTITKSLVELHGGAIRLESDPGIGSRFTFSLPLSDAAADPKASESREASAVKLQESLDSGVKAAEPGAMAFSKAITDAASFTVLLVDDEPVNLQVLSNQLGLHGFRVMCAPDGPSALQAMERNSSVDLVLLDVMMPRMSGYEVCRRLREKATLFELPVLMLTAKNRVEDIVQGFEAGANDYLSKPFDKTELLSRVRTLLTLRRSVQNNSRYLVIKQALDVARRIQVSILPRRLPESPGIDLAAICVPMDEIGGDLWDFHMETTSRLGLFLADVSGHGVPAALIAAMAKVAFSQQKHVCSEPSKLLLGIHETLNGKIEDQFLTACYAFYDSDSRRFLYSSAGHPPLLVCRDASGEIEEFKPSGKLIGYFGDVAFQQSVIELYPGDRVFLYTDGVVEAMDAQGREFGDTELAPFLRRHAAGSSSELITALLENIRSWTGQKNFNDDVTVVTFRVR